MLNLIRFYLPLITLNPNNRNSVFFSPILSKNEHNFLLSDICLFVNLPTINSFNYFILIGCHLPFNQPIVLTD